jgi:hypothetical protein
MRIVMVLTSHNKWGTRDVAGFTNGEEEEMQLTKHSTVSN